MAENTRRKTGDRKEPDKRQAPAMAVRSALKQPEEKNAQRNPGEQEQTYYYSGKEGYLKRDCTWASKPPSTPYPVCKGPHWIKVCPQKYRSQGSDSQDNQD